VEFVKSFEFNFHLKDEFKKYLEERKWNLSLPPSSFGLLAQFPRGLFSPSWAAA